MNISVYLKLKLRVVASFIFLTVICIEIPEKWVLFAGSVGVSCCSLDVFVKMLNCGNQLRQTPLSVLS